MKYGPFSFLHTTLFSFLSIKQNKWKRKWFAVNQLQTTRNIECKAECELHRENDVNLVEETKRSIISLCSREEGKIEEAVKTVVSSGDHKYAAQKMKF